ncbi:hypothetical protein FJM67_08960 [Maribrevibacterium harenarium]|uniref:Uncharacterized protein n=2 Tax=Maribrevibacterium harenarium TaxID=2589817 RepID=A0A501X022_9GAMM|nr:hypothetical protein FJM67_08960 [Maribrevibacterium harenarium]
MQDILTAAIKSGNKCFTMNSLSHYLSEMGDILPHLQKIKVDTIEDGFSNQVYKLSWFNAPRVVVRVPALPEDAFLLNRQVEQKVWRYAAEQMLTPALLWANDEGVVASEYIAAPSLSWQVQHPDEDVIRLAQQLARLHRAPLVNKDYEVYGVIRHYLQQIRHHLPSHSHELNREVDYLQQAFSQLPMMQIERNKVLCHNDLNPKNILMDARHCWLIDWEVAAVGDPAFDLAVLARSHNLTSVQIDLLLQSYGLDHDIVAHRRDVNVLMLAYGLREMAWLLLKHLVTPKDLEALECYYAFKSDPSLNPVVDIERQRWH